MRMSYARRTATRIKCIHVRYAVAIAFYIYVYIYIYIYRYMYIYIYISIYVYIYIYIQLIIVLRMLSTSPHLQCEQDGEELLLVSYQHTATDTRQLFSDSVLNNDGGHILPTRSDDQLCNKPNNTRSIVARQRQSSAERT